MFLDLLKQA